MCIRDSKTIVEQIKEVVNEVKKDQSLEPSSLAAEEQNTTNAKQGTLLNQPQETGHADQTESKQSEESVPAEEELPADEEEPDEYDEGLAI